MRELQGISKILAIRFARLGDVTLLLQSLGSLKTSFDGTCITLITGSPYAPLAELCPFVDEVIPVDRLAMRDGSKSRAARDIIRLVRDLRSRRFDLAVDFHSFRETNLLARACGARYRIGMRRADGGYLPFCFNLPPAEEDKELHVSDMFQRLVQSVPGAWAMDAPALTIDVPPEVCASLPPLSRSRPVVVFYVGASVASRRWPSARFTAVIRHVTEAWGGSALIVGGVSPEEELIARDIASRHAGMPEVQLLSKLSIPQLAAVIRSGDLLVSNDTGPMHIGSALGVPTLGIFSESLPQHYRPIGPNDRYVRKETVEEVEIEDVLELLEGMRLSLIRASPDRQPLS